MVMSVIGIPGEAGVNTKKVTVDLESEEVPGRGTVCEEPRGPGRLGVFGGKWATVVVAPTDSGKDGRPEEFDIFLKLSKSQSVIGARSAVWEEAVPAAGWVKVKDG